MERNGVEAFSYADKYGKAQSGSPELAYLVGGFIITLSLVRAFLFRMDELKTERTNSGTKDTLLFDD